MTEKKKILFIITKSVWGGATRYVADLAEYLPNNKYEAIVAAGPIEAPGRNIFSELGKHRITTHTVKHFQKSVNPLKDLFAFFEVLRLIRKVRPQIIHVSSSKAAGLVGFATFVLRLLKTKKLKVVFTAHGWPYHEERPFWQRWLIKFFSRLTALFADKIICVSDHDRRSAIENRIASVKKLITIHNGLNIGAINMLERNAARAAIPEINEHDKVVGAVGEYVKNKGYEFLIDAAEIITKQAGIKFVIFGHHGPLKELLYQKIELLNLQNSVFLIDNPSSDAARYIKAFDIFAMPSLKEGLPYAILEAGAAGLPVIASEVGGIPEIVENNITGILVPPSNAAHLASAIITSMANIPLRNRLSESLRQKIIRDFSFAEMLRKTIAVYES
jgi:glycosyltransferase involved in cell wall biosynthesis